MAGGSQRGPVGSKWGGGGDPKGQQVSCVRDLSTATHSQGRLLDNMKAPKAPKDDNCTVGKLPRTTVAQFKLTPKHRTFMHHSHPHPQVHTKKKLPRAGPKEYCACSSGLMESPRAPIRFHGDPIGQPMQEPMGTPWGRHGDPWRLHGNPLEPMEPHWNPMRIHGMAMGTPQGPPGGRHGGAIGTTGGIVIGKTWGNNYWPGPFQAVGANYCFPTNYI